MAQVQLPRQAPLSVSNGSLETSVASSSETSVASSSGTVFNANTFPSTSLYVGDLDQNVTDAQLYDTFGQAGQVASVRVIRDMTTRRSLGYAYVNFGNLEDAARAREMLNFTPLYGKPIRIMYSNRDPSFRKSGTANIFIKNLEKTIDNKALMDTFSVFGNILSCKVVTDEFGQSKGFGFVQFDQEEAAQNAIEKLNGMCLNDKPVYVAHFQSKLKRENTSKAPKFNNVFVKNLSKSTTEDHLTEIFGEFGKITSTVVMRTGDGKSKCFGFVNFDNPDDAERAIYELNGKKFDEKEWYVGKAQNKHEREIEMKEIHVSSNKEIVDNNQGLNLFLKNLDDSIGDEKLKDLFSEFGTITSSKVMLDQNGASKGSGFVAFSTAGEASKALSEMNGKLIGSKTLYVAIAQRKEERRAQLQAQYNAMPPESMATYAAPRMPMYSSSAPGMPQQLFYGQGPLAPISTQPLVPGIRPGGAPMSNFFMPLGQPGLQVQRPSARHVGMSPVQPQHSHAMLQQMLPRGRNYCYPPGQNGPDVQMLGYAGGMLSAYGMRGLPSKDPAMVLPSPVDMTTASIANAARDDLRVILGESLYPLVDKIEHENAAKVTGMLLEMDQTEIVHLLESPEALKAKVSEAMEVLNENVADQLAELSLNNGTVY